MSVKLTPVELWVLERIAVATDSFGTEFVPAANLVSGGYAAWGRPRQGVADLRITDAGRALLAQERTDGR